MNHSRTDLDDAAPKEPMWRRYLRMIRPDPAGDLDDELRDHLESSVEDLRRRGLPTDAANAEALRRFGDVSAVRTQVQRLDQQHFARVNRLAWFETFLYDLRHATRGLRRSPVFTTVAALSIGLGVAANATVFSVVNAVLLRPIPGTHADRLVRIYVNHHSPFNWTDLSWFRGKAKSFDHIVGERYGVMAFRAAPGAEAERIHFSYVTHGFFPALGVRMALGRAFDVDEVAHQGTQPITVLSHAFWQRRFAGDSAIVGKRISLGEQAFTVVGVMAPEFRSSVMTWVPDAIIPLSMAPVLTGVRLDQFFGSFYTTAQLHAGTDMNTAQSELQGLMAQLARSDSARHEGMTVRLDHIRGVNAEVRQGATAGSVFLMAMVGMVLLIACGNVANLLLGRAAARRTEIGVRLAIGASRRRVVRQMLTESLLLATLGSAAGFAAAWMLTQLIPATLPAEAGLDTAFFKPDGRVLVFTATLCLLTTVLFGGVPALRAASPDLIGLLKGNGARNERRHKRGWLVSAQTAMCVLLLAVASIFVRSLASMRNVDPGFRPEGLVDVNIDLGLASGGFDRQETFRTIQRNAAALPGVERATLSAVVPLTGSNMETRIVPEGVTSTRRQDHPAVYFNIVAPKYFETLRTPIRRGREFLETDAAQSPPVAVINESAARRLWPNADALGKRFRFANDGPLVQIVGIARDANYVMPGETAKTTIYLPMSQQPRDEMTLQLRTTADVATVRQAVWNLLHTLAPTLPPPAVVRMTDDMSITLLPVRAGVALLGGFGLLALFLAAAGIYGVAAYSVARRTREIGLRAALGATRAMLVRMVLWESGRRVLIGAVIGLTATIAIASLLRGVLYGVEAIDPIVLFVAVSIIGTVAVLATIAPALRAARADPVAAMRVE
jgi:predicted permease